MYTRTACVNAANVHISYMKAPTDYNVHVYTQYVIVLPIVDMTCMRAHPVVVSKFSP